MGTPMSISEKDVEHIARLSAIECSDEELKRYKNELAAILDYVDKLSSVSTHGVRATSHVHGVVNFFRDDLIRDSLDRKTIEENASDFVAGAFRVPKVL